MKSHIDTHLNNYCFFNFIPFLCDSISSFVKKNHLPEDSKYLSYTPPKIMPQRYFLLDTSIFILSIIDALK